MNKKIIYLTLIAIQTVSPLQGFASIPEAEEAFQQAGIFLRENRLDEAEKSLHRAILLDPHRPEYHFELSNVYAARFDELGGDFRNRYAATAMETCLGELRRTITLQPDYIPAHFNMGVIYKKRGDYEDARESFREVLKYNPQEIRAYLQIGEIYETQGFFDEAREAYRAAKAIAGPQEEIQERIQNSYEREAVYEQEMKEGHRSDLFSSRSGAYDRSAASRAGYTESLDQSGEQQGAGMSSLTSLGLMLAQGLLQGKKDAQQ